MNRLNDLKATLEYNLAQHSEQAGRVEFCISIFGQSRETMAWLTYYHEKHIRSGLVRIKIDSSLDTWHFGKAKNSFASYANGQLYSSLDADNFVSLSQTQSLLSTCEAFGSYFVFHHFSGTWGDGTSGRVTLPFEVYSRIGYDERFLPRQFDEVDLILRSLNSYKSLPFVCHGKECSIFERSSTANTFRTVQRLPNPVFYIVPPPSSLIKPINPKSSDYASKNKRLQAMQSFNGNFFLYKNIVNSPTREAYLPEIIRARRMFIKETQGADLFSILFEESTQTTLSISEEITLFCVVRNEQSILPFFVNHYKNLGVERIVIVDDCSSPPISKKDFEFENLFIVRPKVGDFKTFKAGWVDALLKRLMLPGAWAIAVDADEFIILPSGIDLKSYIRTFDNTGCWYALGLLVDVVPQQPKAIAADRYSFKELFSAFAWNYDCQDQPIIDYSQNPSIRWAFGRHAYLSWKRDIRYHAFGTFDCLRKIPLFKYQDDMFLNQGYHAIHSLGNDLVSADDWSESPVLRIDHYKMLNLFLGSNMMTRNRDSYFGRTSQNLLQIFSDSQRSIERLDSLKSNFVPKSDTIY